MSNEIIRLREFQRRIGLARSTVYQRLASDPSFPRPLSLGGRSVGWLVAEVEDWLQSQAARRQSPPSGEL
jgi:prophage regulatory protein